METGLVAKRIKKDAKRDSIFLGNKFSRDRLEINLDTKPQIMLNFDLDIIRNLARLVDADYTPDEVFEKLSQGTLDPMDYKDLPEEELPKVLRDGFLGKVMLGKTSNKEHFINLEELFVVYKAFVDGILELATSESTQKDSFYDDKTADFINAYVKVIKVDSKHRADFEKEKSMLIERYTEDGILDGNRIKYDGVKHTSPACLMAESTIFGLFFVTLREYQFIRDKETGNYELSDKIEITNQEMGYSFMNNYGLRCPIIPIPLRRLAHYLRDFEKYKKYRSFYTIVNNVRAGKYNPVTKTIKV